MRVPLSSSQLAVDDKTASMLETLRYLKGAERDRLEEFADMGDVFTYNAQEEEDAFMRKRFTARRDHDELLLISYKDPMNDPFSFEDVDAMDNADNAPSHCAPATTPTPSNAPATTPQSRASSRSFESAYDVSSALAATPSASQRRAPGLGGSGVLPLTTKGRLDGSNTQRSSINLYSSQLGSTSSAVVSKRTVGLGTVGTAVAQSSVSVTSHVRQGAARMLVMNAQTSVKRHRLFRESCTMEVVAASGIRFCTHCGHCNVVPVAAPAAHSSLSCQKCALTIGGAAVVTGGCGARSSLTSTADDNTIRQIEELERQEALEFQAAIAQWRSGGGTADNVDDRREHSDATQADLTTTSLFSAARFTIPRGTTYFTHLWNEMGRVLEHPPEC